MVFGGRSSSVPNFPASGPIFKAKTNYLKGSGANGINGVASRVEEKIYGDNG
jgi:hypothetical protein